MRKEGQDSAMNRIMARYGAAFEPLAVDGAEYRILSPVNMREHIDSLISQGKIKNPLEDLPLWAKVWPASLILGRFLRKMEPAGKSLLELGSGMGITSLIASGHGFKKITVTDINEDALDFAAVNIEANGLQGIMATVRLDVAQPGLTLPEKADVICASELLYLDDLHRPLIKFISRNLAPGGKALFCVDMSRQKSRFEKMAAKDFHVQSGCVGLKSCDESGEKRSIFRIIILEGK